MTITPSPGNGAHWILFDNDLLTQLGEIRGLNPQLMIQRSDSGSGQITVPFTSPFYDQISTINGKFLALWYRGAYREGFFVEDISGIVKISSKEFSGKAATFTGQTSMGFLGDGFVPDWMTPGQDTVRYFGTKDTVTTYGGAPVPKGLMMYHLLDANRNIQTNSVGQTLEDYIWRLDAIQAGRTLLTWTFSDTLDSLGNPWTDFEDMEFSTGMSILDVMRQIAALGYEFKMVFNPATGTFVLSAYPSKQIVDVSGSIMLQAGRNVLGENWQVHGSEARNYLLVWFSTPSAPYTEVWDAVSLALFRRRKASMFQAADASTEATAISLGQAELNRIALPQKVRSFTLSDARGPRAFVDYGLGYKISVNNAKDPIYTAEIDRMTMQWPGYRRYADVTLDVE